MLRVSIYKIFIIQIAIFTGTAEVRFVQDRRRHAHFFSIFLAARLPLERVQLNRGNKEPK
jgi:hypothetical protein